MAKIRGEAFNAVVAASGDQVAFTVSRLEAIRHRATLDASNNVVLATATGSAGAESFKTYQTVAPSGDVSFAETITSKLAALSVYGRAGNTEGVTAAIVAGVDHGVLRRSGTSIGFGAINLASANAVTGTLAWASVSKTGSSLADLATKAISDTTGDLAWARVSKTGSSLADLATRSASDLNSGTLAVARLHSTVALTSAENVWSQDQLSAATGSGPIADIGSTTTPWKSGYFQDLVRVNLDTANDVSSLGFRLARGSGLLELVQSTSHTSEFAPALRSISIGSGQSFASLHEVQVAADTGTSPVAVHRVRRVGGDAITTRPLFEWANGGTSIARMFPGGQFGIGHTTSPPTRLAVQWSGTDYTNGITLTNTANWGYGSNIVFRAIPATGESVATVAIIRQGYDGSANNFKIDFETMRNGTMERAFTIHSSGHVVFVPRSGAPTTPNPLVNGMVYYDSSVDKLRVYAGGSWVNLH